ncbi:hypothetical protein KC19_1G079000 [Ceratodon purpureus]|uniref:Uncharacterized protein n=1 Tax=Ceratodon purpureus TaxID=3225 RepID=A0A8T0J2N7_CERPU|nr:hypothetical protein KC19_1G079000 [Ceratodon purpureus]
MLVLEVVFECGSNLGESFGFWLCWKRERVNAGVTLGRVSDSGSVGRENERMLVQGPACIENFVGFGGICVCRSFNFLQGVIN